MEAIALSVVVCAGLTYRWLMAREERLRAERVESQQLGAIEADLKALKEAGTALGNAMAAIVNRVGAVEARDGVKRTVMGGR